MDRARAARLRPFPFLSFTGVRGIRILRSSDTGPCIDRPSSAARMASKALRAGQPTPLEMMGMRITMRVLDSSGIHRLLFS
jgi:hypothetical protein